MRIRTIKPEWLDDQKLAAASDEARVLSVALILMSDDYGRGRASIATIAAETWRYALERNGGEQAPEIFARASRALRELVDVGFVILYEVKGQQYFAVTNWKKHQKVDKPSAPRVPAPEEQETSEKPIPRETLATLSRVPGETLASDLDPDPDQEGRGARESANAPAPKPIERPPQPAQLAKARRLDPYDFSGAPTDAAVAALSAACVAAGGVPRTRGGFPSQTAFGQVAMAAHELSAKLGEPVEVLLEQAARGFIAAKGTKGRVEWWAENFEGYLEMGRAAPTTKLDDLEAEQARLVELAAVADPDEQARLHAKIRDIAAERRRLKGAA